MKNILFHMSVIFLLFVMVVMNTGETASARSVYKHKIFSKSVVSKRIDTIKQFYYKKSKQLKTKNQTGVLLEKTADSTPCRQIRKKKDIYSVL